MTADLFSAELSAPSDLPTDLPRPWQDYLGPTDGLAALLARLRHARGPAPVLPLDQSAWFRAFTLCPPAQVRVVVLGQDPYPNRSHAMGLAFSVPAGMALPRSLANIYKELQTDLGVIAPRHGDLSQWARQGVLLANTALTVIEGQADAHTALWADFTQHWIGALGRDAQPRVWVLWGAKAQRFRPLIGSQHIVIESAHPSPLSARRGFFGSRPFSRTNTALTQWGYAPICWV